MVPAHNQKKHLALDHPSEVDYTLRDLLNSALTYININTNAANH